jgi:PEP-CTERM motif
MLRKIAPGLTFLLVTGAVSASVLTSQTTFVANGSQGGNLPVNSEAVFTFTNVTPTTGILTVTLTNLLANPASLAQNITDFSFQLLDSSGITLGPNCASNCLTSATATAGTVTVGANGAGTYASGNVNPNWGVTLNAATFYLNGVTSLHSAAYSIIGPGGSGGNYTNANSSIAGYRNPFVYSTATWTFTLSGLPANFSIGNVNFAFNSGPGDSFSCDADPKHCAAGTTVSSFALQAVPEPMSFLLAGSGLIAFFFLRRGSKA